MLGYYIVVTQSAVAFRLPTYLHICENAQSRSQSSTRDIVGPDVIDAKEGGVMVTVIYYNSHDHRHYYDSSN